MNPVVIDIGPLVLHEYTAWVMSGILLGLALIAGRGYTAERHALRPHTAITPYMAITRWLDVGIVALIASVIGARALHVALDWDYFAQHTQDIDRLKTGGMAWQGGLIAAIPATWITARLRRVPFRAWTDAATLALPIGMMATWQGCRNTGCGYGYEVHTLADWPGWMVAELPDVFGQVAPRLDIQTGGVIFGGIIFALAVLLTWRNWLPGLRLWIVLVIAGLGLLIAGYLRADPTQTILNHRADQALNAWLVIASAGIGGILWLMDRHNTNDLRKGDAMQFEKLSR